MNKTVVAVVAIIACAAVAVGYFIFGRERYVPVNAGGGTVYKVDRVTGEMGLIRGARETPVSSQPPPPPPEPKVIYVPQEVVKVVEKWIPDPTHITIKEVLPAGITQYDIDFASRLKANGINQEKMDFILRFKLNGVNYDDMYYIAHLKSLIKTPNASIDSYDMALESYVESVRSGSPFNTLVSNKSKGYSPKTRKEDRQETINYIGKK